MKPLNLFLIGIFMLFPILSDQYIVLSSLDKVEKKRPNILLIYVDDLRPELNCYGADHIHSPNIDAFAKERFLFEQAYTQWAVCGPSRTSMLTGLRPDASGVYRNKKFFRDNIPNCVSLPQAFKEADYITHGLGKIYHNPKVNDHISWSQKSYYGDRKTHGRGYMLAENQVDNLGPVTEIADIPEDQYPDAKLAQKTIEFLQENKDSSFFLSVGFARPHLPLAAPKEFWDLYDRDEIELPEVKKPKTFKRAFNGMGELRRYKEVPKKGAIDEEKKKELIHAYYACVSFIDTQVGKIVNEVKRLGLDENTIIIFCSDHGWKLGDYDEWGKFSNFEIDTRIPLIISVPGVKSNGHRVDQLVEALDIYPTLNELVGLETPAYLQGKSFAHLLSEEGKSDYSVPAFSQQIRTPYMGYTIRTTNFRFIKWIKPNTDYEFWELYDLMKDPKETINVVNDSAYLEHKNFLNHLLSDSIRTWNSHAERFPELRE